MPQLNSGGGDDLGANDELISFKKTRASRRGEGLRKLLDSVVADVKSSLVNGIRNESKQLLRFRGRKSPSGWWGLNLFPGLGKCC